MVTNFTEQLERSSSGASARGPPIYHNSENRSMPPFVSIHDSNLILMRYTAQAIKEYRGKICHSDLDPECFNSFPEMEWFIFNFINSDDTNWERAKEVVLKEIDKFDEAMNAKVTSRTKKERFYRQLIHYYTTGKNNCLLLTELQEQAMSEYTGEPQTSKHTLL